MALPLRVLMIEDREDDAELVLAELRLGGYAPTSCRVDTEAGLNAALDASPWDAVLSDYSMPTFSGSAALEVLKRRGLDVPFIIVSGTVTEDLAVQAMKAGAHDYVLKDRLRRLNPVLARELREATLRAEQRKLREKLLLADRMASLGALVAGVAHEINNPLTVIVANLDVVSRNVEALLREVAATSEPLRRRGAETLDELRDAREAAARVAGIVAGLKTLTRADDIERTAVDVQRVIDFASKVAWNEIRHRARLVKVFGPVAPVLGNEGRLGQVILNLLVNAAQAIAEGHAEHNEICVTTRMRGDGRVEVSVRDTGPGIADDVLPRIFDPFFTSKPIGLGSGLGLAICDGIVRAHEGEIEVESVAGRGTEFRVLLPAAAAVAPTAAPAVSLAPQPRGRGRVLVVDDEPSIGTVLERFLRDDNDVAVVSSARKALELFAQGERFDVILCDMMMPEQTGADLYDVLARAHPDQAERMVFLTGGAFAPRAREFLDRVPNLRVDKPFEGRAVRALVARLVSGRDDAQRA